MRKKADLQGEIERLNQALREIMAACEAPKPEPSAWPQAVGAIQCIAREALGYNVTRIEGPFRFDGLTADGIPRLVKATP